MDGYFRISGIEIGITEPTVTARPRVRREEGRCREHQYLAGAGLGLYLLDAGVLFAVDLQQALERQRTELGLRRD